MKITYNLKDPTPHFVVSEGSIYCAIAISDPSVGRNHSTIRMLVNHAKQEVLRKVQSNHDTQDQQQEDTRSRSQR